MIHLQSPNVLQYVFSLGRSIPAMGPKPRPFPPDPSLQLHCGALPSPPSFLPFPFVVRLDPEERHHVTRRLGSHSMESPHPYGTGSS